jgi:hypothetical protein
VIKLLLNPAIFSGIAFSLLICQSMKDDSIYLQLLALLNS